MSKRNSVEQTLEAVDARKRTTLKRMASMAFVVPVVASFAMDGLTVGPALAQNANVTTSSGNIFLPPAP